VRRPARAAGAAPGSIPRRSSRLTATRSHRAPSRGCRSPPRRSP
jgi:hypothetical protein